MSLSSFFPPWVGGLDSSVPWDGAWLELSLSSLLEQPLSAAKVRTRVKNRASSFLPFIIHYLHFCFVGLCKMLRFFLNSFIN